MAVTQVYITEKGTTWDTEAEAIVADVLEQTSIYIESYKFKDIVKAIANKIIFMQYRVKDNGEESAQP